MFPITSHFYYDFNDVIKIRIQLTKTNILYFILWLKYLNVNSGSTYYYNWRMKAFLSKRSEPRKRAEHFAASSRNLDRLRIRKTSWDSHGFARRRVTIVVQLCRIRGRGRGRRGQIGRFRGIALAGRDRGRGVVRRGGWGWMLFCFEPQWINGVAGGDQRRGWKGFFGGRWGGGRGRVHGPCVPARGPVRVPGHWSWWRTHIELENWNLFTFA